MAHYQQRRRRRRRRRRCGMMDEFTRKLYFGHTNGENQGPSVNSDDLEERIAARPGYYDEKPATEQSTAEDAANLTSKENAQFAESMHRIINLCRNGNAFITNIRVACDARENLRRVEEKELANVRLAKFEAERKATEKLFEDVEEKWKETESVTGPHDLYDLMEGLKNSCAKIIDEKNKLIYDIHLELKAKDDHFVKELKKRVEDVDLMVERMESQMKSMQSAYDFELKEIEKAFIEDRDNLLNGQKDEWDEFIHELRKKQEDYLEERKNRVVELEDLIQKLRTNHSEEYNALNLRLSTEVQNMETDLQQMKATYQLNLEKLEYNFQVLKRRDEENTLTRSQQKRKITQLQDHLNRLRIKSNKLEESLQYGNSDLSEDYKKLMESFKELQKKSRKLVKYEEENFRDVWIMNEDEIRKAAEKLMKADRIISEQQLGLQWKRPKISFMNNNGPISLAERERRNTSMAARILKQNVQKRQQMQSKRVTGCRLPQTLEEAPREIVNDFLTMLSFEPEFLIERKVKKLLKSMPPEDQKLIRLDSVLTVLKVNDEEKLNKLFTYFLRKCDGSGPVVVETTPTQSVPRTANDNGALNTESDGPICDSLKNVSPIPTENITTTFNAELAQGVVELIDPVDVPRALYRFAVENCSPDTAALIDASISTAAVTNVDDIDFETDELEYPRTDEDVQMMMSSQQDALDIEMDKAHWQKYLEEANVGSIKTGATAVFEHPKDKIKTDL
ncbi:hypothetical protein Aperf_G00000078963 [Anoplocephala perfoliata]